MFREQRVPLYQIQCIRRQSSSFAIRPNRPYNHLDDNVNNAFTLKPGDALNTNLAVVRDDLTVQL